MRNKFGYIVLSAITISLISQLFILSAPKQQVNSCPVKPYPVSNAFNRGIQKVFGLNLLASKKAESEIKKQLASVAKGNFDVDIKPYSAMDLVAGKLRYFELNGKNIVIDDVYISAFQAKSLCDFIYLDYKKDPIVPLAPVYVGFKGTVTENDLNKTLSSEKYREEISKIKINFMNTEISLVDFLNSRVNIENNKIYFSTDIKFSGLPKFMRIPVKMGAGLKVSNDKIRLADIEIGSNNFGVDLGPLGGLMEMMSPAIFDLDTLEKKGTDVVVKNISIQNNQIDVDGTVWMPGAAVRS